jgi:hypothetical protein
VKLKDSTSGKEVLDECGAIVGKIVSADESTGSFTLTHIAVFDPKNMFRTGGDKGEIMVQCRTDASFL